ncbi:MAG: hypothetical protein O3B95_08885 [Chloroflexi bacterium]|nr:hypothetical protein [Chloroflexota bacterium]
MGWEVFATAPDQMIGESWCVLVRSAGIDCKLQPGDVIGFIGVSVLPVRLMAKSEDLEIAKSVLESYIGDDELPPEPEHAGDL